MNKYYFSLKSVELSDYLNKAIFSDPILRKEPFFFESDNLCIGLVLSSDEKERLENLENDNFIYKGALPMSRLIGMYFDSKDQLETTINNIEIREAIPQNKMITHQKSLSSAQTSIVFPQSFVNYLCLFCPIFLCIKTYF